MGKSLFTVGATGSTIAYFDLGYGFAVIVLGLFFILLLEAWNYKNKHRKPPDEPPMGI